MWAKEKELGSTFSILLMQKLERVFGRKISHKLLYLVIPYFYLLLKKQRTNSLSLFKTLQKLGLYKKNIYRGSFQHFYEFGCHLIDKLALSNGELTYGQIRKIGTDPLKKRVTNKEGAVIIGAHLGNLEVVNVLSEELPELCVHALMHIENSEKFRALQKINAYYSGLRIIPLENFAPSVFIELEKIVQGGGVIAMMGDRPTPGAADKTSKGEIFQNQIDLPQGPWIVAELLKTPIFLAFSIRNTQDNGYDIYVEEFFGSTAPNRTIRIEENIKSYAKILERYILKAPEQFFNFHLSWK